jgi:hypothetical protein
MNEGFVGWCRLGRAAWRRVVQAASENEAWQLLPGMAPVAAQRDLCVLPAGSDPNRRRQGLRQRAQATLFATRRRETPDDAVAGPPGGLDSEHLNKR